MKTDAIRSRLFQYLLMTWITGTLFIDFMRIVPSLSMVLLVLLGLSYLFAPSGNTPPHKVPFLALSATFLLLLPSALYSDNLAYLGEKLQIAVPYLLLPAAFILIPALPKRSIQHCYAYYVLLVSLISVSAFGYYLLHQESINQLYLESRVMPTLQSHHPTFSLMLVVAVYLAWHLYLQEYHLRNKWEKHLLLAAGIFLFVFIHIFSVRSGLLALYLVAAYETYRMVRLSKHPKTILLTAGLMALTGAGTMLLSPTMRNKLENTRADMANIQENGSGNNQSLTSRVISYKIAWRIARESSLLTGCGLGDLKDKTEAIFDSDYPDISKRIIVHNQFLFYMAGIGLPAAVAFAMLLLVPLFYRKNFQHPLLVMFYLVLLVYLNVESPMETQIGVSFTLLFLLLPLHEQQGSKGA